MVQTNMSKRVERLLYNQLLQANSLKGSFEDAKVHRACSKRHAEIDNVIDNDFNRQGQPFFRRSGL
jgi:hypothetical protein